MSKAAKEDKNAAMKPVVLPSLPRCDENNRAKWSGEYDKVEAELLKTHVPGASTVTMGLRMIPSTFDRTVPPPDAENEADERRRRRAAGVPRARTTEPGGAASNAYGHSTPPPPGPPGAFASPAGSPTRRPRSARGNNAGARLATATPLPTKNTAELLRLLFTLLDPPLDFKSSVGLDLSGIDLRWLKSYDSGDRAPTLNTLDTFRDDPGDVPPLNSPRSAIVVLRNGVATEDLQVKPVADFRSLDTSEEQAECRCRHREERRALLLESLRDEYRELSATLPLFELLDDVSAFRLGEWKTTAGRGRGVEERKRFSDYAEARRKERLEAAQREKLIKHELAEQRREAAAARFQTVIEERRRAAASGVKTGGLSPRSAAIAEEEQAKRVAEQAEAKREMADRKRQQQAVSHEQHLQEAKQKALRNEHRMRKNRELLERQQREQEIQQQQREENARQRREAVEHDRAMRKAQQLEASRKAAEARDAAKAKAAGHEAKLRADAEARRQRADERLSAFSSFKQSQQQQAASMEAAKRNHRLQAARRAEEQRAQERDRLLQRQEATAERVSVMRERRTAEVGAARLQHQLEAEDKHFLVERQRRADDFKKLLFVTDLAEKKQRADQVSLRRSHSSMS